MTFVIIKPQLLPFLILSTSLKYTYEHKYPWTFWQIFTFIIHNFILLSYKISISFLKIHVYMYSFTDSLISVLQFT